MSQDRKKSALEAVTNTVTGIVLNQVVLYLAGIPLKHAIGLTVIMFFVSTARSYVIRRIFN
jgi:hypothetical protein